jgi:hypothetical protein
VINLIGEEAQDGLCEFEKFSVDILKDQTKKLKADSQTKQQTVKLTDRQANKQTHRQTDRQTNRQSNKLTN